MSFFYCIALGIAVVVSAPASAAPVAVGSTPIVLTLELSLGQYAPQIATANGVAVLSGLGPLGATAVRLDSISGTFNGAPGVLGVPRATFPVTGGRWLSFINTISVGASIRPGGTFAPITGHQQLTLKEYTLRGGLFANIFNPGSFGISFYDNRFGFEFTVGVGGDMFIPHAVDFLPRVFATAHPWTLGTTTLSTRTPSGAYETVMKTGFLHAPTSSTTSVVHYGGALQLITPTQFSTYSAPPGSVNLSVLPLFTSLTIQFVPEPKAALVLVSGAVFLLLVGRKRIQIH